MSTESSTLLASAPQHTNSPQDNDSISSTESQNESPRRHPSIKSLKPHQLIWLLKLGFSELPLLIIGCIALVIAAASNLIVPSFIGSMIDSSLQETSGASLRKLVLIISIFVAVQGVFTFIRAFAFNCAAERVVAKLRKQLFNRILIQEIAFFDERKTGDLINRLSSDTKTLENTVTVNISMALRNLIQAVGGLAILFVISWRLALVMLAVVPTFIILAVIYGRFVQKLAKRFQDALAEASNVAEESLSNVRTVRSFSRERRQIDLYAMSIDVSYKLARTLAFARGSFASFGIIIGNLALVVVIWYGGTLVLNKEMTVGDLTSFLLYTVYIAMSIAMLSSLFYDILKAIGATKEIHDLIHREPSIPAITDDNRKQLFLNPPVVEGNIQFSHVTFKYASRGTEPVLRDLSFKIPAHTTTAFVGQSGAGKSTIAALLQRWYDVDSGEISIDGYNIASMQPEFLHENIAVVSQEPALFDTTIRENILFGNPHATEQEIIEAAKKANAYDFIMEFPDQFETIVGPRGHKCSGGERQRIAIARAIVSRAKILLLDESTSNLDARNEKAVQQALDRLMQEKGRTAIVIAHRLSSVQHADRIMVLDKGDIVEQGKHAELLQRNGFYKKLVQAQLFE